MRLDTDLVRALLLQSEAAPPNQAPTIDLPDYDRDAVLEHVELLRERGLIEARIVRSGSGGGRIYTAHVERLTWEGHEFLQNARNEEVWQRAKTLVREKGGSISFELFKALLVKLAAQQFGL